MLHTGDILIVDCDGPTLALIADVLCEAGYATRTAHNAETALATIRTHQPDLLLVDIPPVGIGVNILAELCSSGITDMATIAMTTDLRVAEDLVTHNIACLTKPFGLDELLDVVAKHLCPHRQRYHVG
jgi:two-component system, NtrC family, nitrogen regulation response regulator NtrX